MAYAQASDVEVLLARELTTEEAALAERLLSRVERKIKVRIPDLDDRVAADADYEATVIDIEASIATRIIRNPEGYTLETDGNYTYQRSAEASDNRITLSAEEWEELGLAPTGAKVFVVRPKYQLPWVT